jgi:hypothetical protein
VIVGGVEQLHVQDATDAGNGFATQADRLCGYGIVVGFRITFGAGHNFHAVRAKGVQLAQIGSQSDGFEVGVAGDEEVAVPGFEQIDAGGNGVRLL